MCICCKHACLHQFLIVKSQQKRIELVIRLEGGQGQLGETEGAEKRRNLLPLGHQVFHGVQPGPQVPGGAGDRDDVHLHLLLHPTGLATISILSSLHFVKKS